MNETQMTRVVMKNWGDRRSDLLWYHKIADPTFGANSTGSRAVDIIACYDGLCVAIEWKFKRNALSFPFKKIRQEQIATLCDVAICGGLGLIIIGTYIDRKNKYIHAIPINAWNDTVGKYVNLTNQKSINIETYFDEYRINVYKEGCREIWDMGIVETMIKYLKQMINE